MPCSWLRAYNDASLRVRLRHQRVKKKYVTWPLAVAGSRPRLWRPEDPGVGRPNPARRGERVRGKQMATGIRKSGKASSRRFFFSFAATRRRSSGRYRHFNFEKENAFLASFITPRKRVFAVLVRFSEKRSTFLARFWHCDALFLRFLALLRVFGFFFRAPRAS